MPLQHGLPPSHIPSSARDRLEGPAAHRNSRHCLLFVVSLLLCIRAHGIAVPSCPLPEGGRLGSCAAAGARGPSRWASKANQHRSCALSATAHTLNGIEGFESIALSRPCSYTAAASWHRPHLGPYYTYLPSPVPRQRRSYNSLTESVPRQRVSFLHAALQCFHVAYIGASEAGTCVAARGRVSLRQSPPLLPCRAIVRHGARARMQALPVLCAATVTVWRGRKPHIPRPPTPLQLAVGWPACKAPLTPSMPPHCPCRPPPPPLRCLLEALQQQPSSSGPLCVLQPQRRGGVRLL